MSFSMFSLSHFSNFLSDPIGKQSAMSKKRSRGDCNWRLSSWETKAYGTSESETNQLGITQPVERETLHRIWSTWSIGWVPMNEMKWKQQQGNLCKPLQRQKSDILKWVDKKMFWWQREPCAWSKLQKPSDQREPLTSPAQGNLCRAQLQG